MTRCCTVCAHRERVAIDAALVAGQSYRSIALQFALGPMAVARHAQKHLLPSLAKAREAEEIANADQLLAQVRDLHARTLAILAEAEDSGDKRTALQAIREARGNLELLAKLLGQLAAQPTINVLLMPEWVRVRSVLLNALEPYPQARETVAQALLEAENAVG